jgi:hypothetical protein
MGVFHTTFDQALSHILRIPGNLLDTRNNDLLPSILRAYNKAPGNLENQGPCVKGRHKRKEACPSILAY